MSLHENEGLGLGSRVMVRVRVETLRISSIRLGKWSEVSRSLSRRCSEIVGVGSG